MEKALASLGFSVSFLLVLLFVDASEPVLDPVRACFISLLIMNTEPHEFAMSEVSQGERRHDSFFDCFYVALFSALEQTHCARM